MTSAEHARHTLEVLMAQAEGFALHNLDIGSDSMLAGLWLDRLSSSSERFEINSWTRQTHQGKRAGSRSLPAHIG